MWINFYNFLTTNKLLNSTLFLGLITLTVGLVALYLYRKQKRDERQDAATVLLAEIKSAVSRLPDLTKRFKANQMGTLAENTLLMPSESWSKFKYLFLNDLKDEEWEGLNEFYKNAINYDDAVREYQTYFLNNMSENWVSIHKNYYETMRDFFRKHPTATDINKNTEDKVLNFTNKYISNAYSLAGYIPQKPLTDAETALDNIDRTIVISSVGTHLGAISKPQSFWRRTESAGK